MNLSLQKNPHFEGMTPPYSFALAHIPAGSQIGQILQQESRDLWHIYQGLSERLVPRSLINAIHLPCSKLSSDKGFVSSFIRGLSQSVATRAAEQLDVFAEAQAYVCCIASLLPFVNSDDEAEGTISGLCRTLSQLLQGTLEEVYKKMTNDPFALLSTKGGLADLFVLPLRISKVLGWAGAHTYISRSCNINCDESVQLLDNISRSINDNYGDSIVCVSDLQAPYLLCALLELLTNKYDDRVQIIFGSIFNSYIEHKGLIADTNIQSNKLPEFLLRRFSKESRNAREIYAQPDHLLSVLFFVAAKAGLQDVVDPYLERIDHKMFNVFIPADHTRFGATSIRNGVNITFQIGSEHGLGVFKTSDFKNWWEKTCVPRLDAEPRAESEPIRMASLITAMLLPDRIPWLAFHNQ